VTDFKRDYAAPPWPERLTRFCEWEWSEDEIIEAAQAAAQRHADRNGLPEPLPAESWPHRMTAAHAWSWHRRRWARENGRAQDLVDEMERRRIERCRLGVELPEDAR
jgi:hypothetical protein